MFFNELLTRFAIISLSLWTSSDQEFSDKGNWQTFTCCYERQMKRWVAFFISYIKVWVLSKNEIDDQLVLICAGIVKRSTTMVVHTIDIHLPSLQKKAKRKSRITLCSHMKSILSCVICDVNICLQDIHHVIQKLKISKERCEIQCSVSLFASSIYPFFELFFS